MILHQRPLRTIYNILLLANSTLLTLTLFCGVPKTLFPIDDFRFLFHRKKYNPLLLPCPFCRTEPPARPLNLIYILLIPWLLLLVSLTYTGS